jgi:hypothetical protein
LGNKSVHIFGRKVLKEDKHLGDLSVDGRITLKYIGLEGV